ncbi:hypothetical protein BEL04_20390 [Mucilaginibacter sp. PPCGB 2223]|uniref:hypothetical protein n=1 Tax=Mucilaginibacter sp. PPCGB 2223 TaxID=1886027 RepID=UPI0008259069|nr:hypothetical protein [Mucilaginibacter sp. PPCGB 2223]OCX51264.1 hypothetical protein BEL04_20390 [Mucilaginibacter sp. PPCGB 2223]
MKKLMLSAAMLLAVLSFGPAKAQLRISLNLNIGSQPDWGPVGYDHAEYYYMPDIGVYYDVPHAQYVYPNGNTWVRTTVLPPRYHNFDLYSGYKVVINEPAPYLRDNVYRTRYAQYRGHRGQPVIRDSHDPKYRRDNDRDDRHDNGRRHDDHHDNGRGHDDHHDNGHH